MWWRFCCSCYYHTDMRNTNVQLNAHISNKYALCLCIYIVYSSVQEHITVFESNGTHPLPPYRIQPQRLGEAEKKLPYDYARCSSQMRTEKKFKFPTKSSKNCVNIQAQISLNFVYLFF